MAGRSGAQQGGLYESSSPLVLFAEICNLKFAIFILFKDSCIEI